MQPTLGVEPRRDALAPRVCLRHYPRITGLIHLSGIYGSGTKVGDIEWGLSRTGFPLNPKQ